MDKIKTVIIVDSMGSESGTPAEEIAEIIETLKNDWNLPVEVVAAGEGAYVLDDQNPDLVIIDYGGMMPGCEDTVNSNIRYVLDWASEHPGKLVILWTDFTYLIYHHEFEEEFSDRDNILFRYSDGHANGVLSEMFSSKYTIEKVRRWFGVNSLYFSVIS